MHVRTPGERWQALAGLLHRLERAAEWTARVEGVQYVTQGSQDRDPWADDHLHLASFLRDLERLDRAVDWQLDQLTAEYLYLTLKRRAAADRATALHASAQNQPDSLVKIA